MRYFWTFFWTFLLVQMVNYVAGSMMGAEFDLKMGSIIAVIVTFLIFIVSAILPEGPTEKDAI